jgi:DNA-binding MarR family transcriptional regulator
MRKINRNFFSKSTCKIFLFIGERQDGSLTFQTQIADELKTPITTINYHITKLKVVGLINKYLELTNTGKKLFKALWENKNKALLRAHNIQVVFKVIKCPYPFPNCFSKSIYQLTTNGKYNGIKTELDGITVMFYSGKKIVCVFHDIFGNTDEEISSTVQTLIPQLRDLLENEFLGIKLGDHEIARIQSMHIAVLDSYIAKKYLLKGFTKENKEFAIDKSHGVPEVELTNPSTALKDIMDLLRLDGLKSAQLNSTIKEEPTNKQENNTKIS